MPDQFIPYGEGWVHQTHALSGAFTMSVPLNACGVLVQALTQNIRYMLDGSTPTASKGFQLKAGDPPLYIPIVSGMTLKWIQESSGAILEYEYSRPR